MENNSKEIELDVNLYNRILLPCPVTGHPPPTIAWFRQTIPINRKNISSHLNTFNISNNSYIDDQNINTYLHPNGSLEIRKVEKTDNDRYHCTATNPAGTITRYIQLNVNSNYLLKTIVFIFLYFSKFHLG